VAERYEDTIKIKKENTKIKCENEKLKKELQEQAKHSTVVIESLDHDKNLAYENKKLKEENQYIKLGLLYDKQEEDESFILEELNSKNDPIIKRLTQENNKLKVEKEHLTKGIAKFTRGKDLQSDLFMNTVMKMDKSGIGYKLNKASFSSHKPFMINQASPSQRDALSVDKRVTLLMSLRHHYHHLYPSMQDHLLSMITTL